MKYGTLNGKEYSTRHGGPFDRGAADSYYGRGQDVHYFVGDSYNSVRLEQVDMSENEVEAYLAGYQWNELYGDKKDWS